MNNNTFKVVRLSDGKVLLSNLHPVSAATHAAAWNRNFYNRGNYCEVRGPEITGLLP